MKTFVFLCQLFAIYTWTVEAAPAPSTLRLVNAIYRHGDRNPIYTYHNDPNQGHVWPQGPGWLSKIGMRQQYALGQYLRSEYSNFLSSSYERTEISVKSSDVDRCLMSAYCNLAGLYPPSGDQVWNPSLLWQPIPVHTRPIEEDNMLSLQKTCNRYNLLLTQLSQSPVAQEVQRANAAFYQFVYQSAGVDCSNIFDCLMMTDTLYAENSHNLTLPEWTRQKFNNVTAFSKLIEIRDLAFSLMFNGTERSRLTGGPLLKELLQNMENAVSGNGSSSKMYMYCGHDSTLSAVMSAMSIFNNREPPYASLLLVELHNVAGVFCVKTRYRNETTGQPHIFQHPACQQECCPLDQYIEVTRDRVPVDWDVECLNVA